MRASDGVVVLRIEIYSSDTVRRTRFSVSILPYCAAEECGGERFDIFQLRRSRLRDRLQPALNSAGPEDQAVCVIRGRRITPADVQSVQELLSQKPDLGRWGLGLELCQRWQWRTRPGGWKERAAAAVLSGMAKRGWIVLPASSRSLSPGPARGPKAEGWPSEAIAGPLKEYRPLRWELVQSAEQRRQWRQLLDAYHYLGAPGMVGANLKYFVCGPAGQLLGALGWQSAVGHLGCRNRLLAWNPEQRARYLDRLVNNVRFLVLPWVKVHPPALG
jgi:hypothetical protein